MPLDGRHRGSVRASHPAAPGSNLGRAQDYSIYSEMAYTALFLKIN